MTPDLSARVAALEAREKARDVLVLATARFLVNRSSILYLDHSLTEFEAVIFPVPQSAAPPPPAAAPELEPDVIGRVREELTEILERPGVLKPSSYYRQTIHEALRLLGARP